MNFRALYKIIAILALAALAAGCGGGSGQAFDFNNLTQPTISPLLTGMDAEGLMDYIKWFDNPESYQNPLFPQPQADGTPPKVSSKVQLLDPACGLSYDYAHMVSADFWTVQSKYIGPTMHLSSTADARANNSHALYNDNTQQALYILKGYSMASNQAQVPCDDKAGHRTAGYIALRLDLANGRWNVDGYASPGATIEIKISIGNEEAPLKSLTELDDSVGTFVWPQRLALFQVTAENFNRVQKFARISNSQDITRQLYWLRTGDLSPAIATYAGSQDCLAVIAFYAPNGTDGKYSSGSTLCNSQVKRALEQTSSGSYFSQVNDPSLLTYGLLSLDRSYNQDDSLPNSTWDDDNDDAGKGFLSGSGNSSAAWKGEVDGSAGNTVNEQYLALLASTATAPGTGQTLHITCNGAAASVYEKHSTGPNSEQARAEAFCGLQQNLKKIYNGTAFTESQLPPELGDWNTLPDDVFPVLANNGGQTVDEVKKNGLLAGLIGFAGEPNLTGNPLHEQSVTITPSFATSQVTTDAEQSQFWYDHSFIFNSKNNTFTVMAFSTDDPNKIMNGLRGDTGNGIPYIQSPLTHVEIDVSNTLNMGNTGVYSSDWLPTYSTWQNGPSTSLSINYNPLFQFTQALTSAINGLVYNVYSMSVGSFTTSLTKSATQNMLALPNLEQYQVLYYSTGDQPVYATSDLVPDPAEYSRVLAQKNNQGVSSLSTQQKNELICAEGQQKSGSFSYLLSDQNPNQQNDAATYSMCVVQQPVYQFWSWFRGLAFLLLILLIARYFYGMMLFETGQIRLIGFFARVLIASGLVLGMNVIIALLSKGVAEAILVTDIAGTAMSGGQPYNHLWIFATYLKSPPHDLGVLIFFLLAPFSILGLFFILISNWLRLGIALFVVGVSPIWVISLLTDRQMKLFISGLNLMMRLYMVPLATLVLLLGLFMFSKTMGFNPGHQTSILDVGAVVMTCLYMIFVAIVPWFLAKYIGAVPAKAIAAAVTRTQEAADAQGSTWLDSKGLGSGREKAGITAQSADETATAAAARLALASRTGPGGPGRGQGEGEGETFGRDPRLGPGGPGGPGGGPGGPSGPGGGLRGASSADDEEKPRNPAEELAGVSDKTARGALAKGDEAPAASSEDAAPALGEGIPKPKTKEATTGEIAKAVDDEAAELAAGDQEKAAGLPAGDKEEAAELAAGDQEKAAGGGLKELGPGEKRDPLTEIAEPSKLTDSAKAGDPKAAAETSLDSYKANPTRQDLPKSKGRRGLEKLGGFVANSAKFVGTGAVQDVKSEYISALRHQGNVFKAAGFLGTVTGSEFVARHPAGEYKRAAKEVAHFNSPAGVQARLNMPQNVRAKQQYDQAAKTIQRFKENPPMEVMTARRMSALKQALTTAGSPQEALKIQKDMAELQSDVLKNNPEYARAMTMQQQAIAMARPSSQDAALIARYQQIVASTKADGGPGTHWEAWTDSALVNDIKDRGQAWVGDFQADMAQWQAGQRSGFANNDLFVRFAGSSAKAGGQIQTQMLTQNKEWANQAKTRQAALERSQKDMVALGTVKARAETTRSNRAQLISDLGQNTVNSQAGMYARLGPLAQSGNVAQMNEEIERQRHVEMGNLHQATKPIEEQMYKQFDTVIPAIAGSTKPADWAARAPEIERQLPVEQQPVFHQLVKQRQAAAAPYTRRLDALEETAVRLADPTQLPVMRQEIVTKYGAAVSSAADVAHQVTAQAENIIYDVSAARVKNDRGAEREAMARQEKLLLSVNDPEARQRLSGLIGQSIEDETELMRTETAAQRSYREATTAQGAPALYHAIHLGDTVSSFRKSSQVQAAESLRNQRIAERGANAQAALESYQAELPHLRQQAASGDERAKEALSETETSIATAQRIIDGVAARERANELGTQATRNLRAQSVVEARKDLARQEERLNAQRAAEENAEVLYNKMLASQARGTADGAAITRTYQRLQDQKTRTQKELDLWREKQEDVELLNNGDIREPKRSTPPTVISPEKAKTEEKEKEKEAKRMQGDVKEMNTEDQQREAARQAAIEEQRQQDAISLAETQHEQEEARKAEDARVAAVKAAQNLPPTQALPPTQNVAQFDPAAHAAEAEARQAEQEAEARRKQAHEESVTRQAEATRKVEEAKKAEEARVTEEARKAEEARQAEITRLAEVERQRVETEKQAEIDRQVAATQKAAEEAAAAKKAVDEAETAERAKVEKARQAEVERRLEAGRAVETSRWNQLSFGERRETMYNNGAVQNAYEIQIKAIDDYEQRLRAKYEGIMEAEQPEEGSKWWNMFHDHLTMKLDEVEGLRRETQVNFEGGGLPPQQQITAFQRRTREIEGMNW